MSRYSSYRSPIVLAAIFFLLPGAFFLLLVSPAAALDWTTETVDSTGDVGQYTSLSLDDAGRPRISYMDFTNYRLKYASKTGGVWIAETVDATHGTGEYSSLELDSFGQPLISYYDVNRGNLSFAAKTGDIWTIMTADSGGVGRHTSLARDRSGNPHISYQDLSNMKLKYATLNSGTWINETADSGNVGAYSSLVLDSAGNPGISYYDAAHGWLKYTARNGDLWSAIAIDTTGNAGYYTSIALDNAGNPGISYYDGVSRDLKFASRTGGVWKKESVDSAGNVGLYTSLSFDGSGNPHISYYDATNGHLKYAVRSGTNWTNETVDTGVNTGLYTSLSLDSSGNPRISYRDGGNGDLRYATGIPPLVLNFSALPLDGTAPLNVQFYDTSIGGSPSCWNWSFGDGAWFNTSIAAEKNPAHTYENPGTYGVTLVVRNFTVPAELGRPGYITVAVVPVTTPPTASPTPTPLESPTPLPTSPDPAPTPTTEPISSVSPTPSAPPNPEPTPSVSPVPSPSPTPYLTPSPAQSPLPVDIPENGDDPPPAPYQTTARPDAGPFEIQTVNAGGDSAVRRVTITGRDTTDCIVTARQLVILPGGIIPPHVPVYQFVDVTAARCPLVSAVQLEFDIPLSFINENYATLDDVRLWMHRNQTWVCLPTRSLGIKNGQAHFSAESPEFLLFAAVLENKTLAGEGDIFPVPPEEDTGMGDASPETGVLSRSYTPAPPAPAGQETKNSLTPAIIGAAGLCGLGIGAIIIRRRRIKL